MRPGNLVPSFYFYKFSEALSGPYTALSAYSSGIIDSSGNILKPESSIDPFEYLIIKLKKIIEQLPYGMTKSQLGNYLSTIRMFSEELEKYEITKDQFDCMMEGFIMLKTDNQLSYLELLEDMSVGAGGGGAGSLGTPMGNSSSPTVAGFDPVMNMPMGRRKPAPKYFDNCEVFEIDPEEFMQFKVAKGWNEIPKGKNSEYIRRFQSRNKGKKIAVKSLNPLNGEHELQWIEYPSPNFMGEGFDPSDAAREITNAAVRDVINPPKIDKTKSGGLKRGAKTQRAGFLFSTVADLIQGGKKHHEKTAETLQPYVGQDVFLPGIDTMVYDETKGIFVPGDLKADTTTPKYSLTDDDIAKIPKLSSTIQRLRTRIERRPFNRDQKRSARTEVENIGKENAEKVKPIFAPALLNLDPNLQWVITPGKSDKPYHYSGLAARIPTKAIREYGKNFDPTLGLRIGENRVEVIARGKEPSVSAVAQQLKQSAFNTSQDEIVGALEKLVSPAIQRRLMQHLRDYLTRID